MFKNMRKPIYLALIFIIPMVMSFLLYHYHENFNFKTTNRGTLMQPILSVKSILTDNKKWRIVYVEDENCDDQCRKTLYFLQQIKTALGKDRNRVHIEILAHDKPATHQFKQTVAPYTKRIYLVDPEDNAFMYYSESTDPMNILKDLKHVLGVSQIG